MIILVTYFVWFMFYSIVGWIWEASVKTLENKKFINTGFLNGPYCPIYGFGVIFMVVLLSGIDNIFLLFMASGTLACILEYITSWAMEKIFHMRWWDYSNDILNINGRVCLKAFLAFGVLGAVAVKFVHPFVASITAQIPEYVLIIIAIILLVVIVADLLHTVIRLTKFNKKLKKYTNDFDEYFKQSLEQSKEFSEKLREDIQKRFDESQAIIYKRLNLVEKRIIRDYPRLQSTRYNEALQNIRKQLRANKSKSKSKSGTKTKKAKSRD